MHSNTLKLLGKSGFKYTKDLNTLKAKDTTAVQKTLQLVLTVILEFFFSSGDGNFAKKLDDGTATAGFNSHLCVTGRALLIQAPCFRVVKKEATANKAIHDALQAGSSPNPS